MRGTRALAKAVSQTAPLAYLRTMNRRVLPAFAVAPLLALVALLGAACAPFTFDGVASARPEAASGPVEMVAAANPLAVRAGMAVLHRGGSAVDAAVAIQATLGLVEPQSSGLGGGAFMLYYDGATHRVTAYDGRERAPAGATADMFEGPDGRPLPFGSAVVSGRATGTPGAVAMLALAQKEHGRLPWSGLFGDAISTAEDGFPMSPRLSRLVNSGAAETKQPDFLAYFTEADGTLMETGDRVVNPAYAATLRRLAAEGPSALYEGPIAEAIAARTRQEPLAGTMTTADLKAYRPQSHEALCRPWLAMVVCVPPPPSSGVSLLQALAIAALKPEIRGGPGSADAWATFIETERAMYADRDRYIGDPEFVSVPVRGLLDPAYVAGRAELVTARGGPAFQAGKPHGAPARGPDSTMEPHGTSHLVIVDRWGNVVSMTTTVESLFGTGRMVGGFFLNNQLTDFSFLPTDPDGAPAANAAAPNKRPRSSMSPIIVTDPQGRFIAALGSPGGSAILGYNFKAMIGLFMWNLTPQQAIELPNLIGRGTSYTGEAQKLDPAVRAELKARGIDIRTGANEESGIQAIVRRNGRLQGGADPRREGIVMAWPEDEASSPPG
jgi:gamma-glutamyltranspeptidase/glutathione hydrolase